MKTLAEDKARELEALNAWLLKEQGMVVKDAPFQDLQQAKKSLAEAREALARAGTGMDAPEYKWRVMAEKAVDIRLEQKQLKEISEYNKDPSQPMSDGTVPEEDLAVCLANDPNHELLGFITVPGLSTMMVASYTASEMSEEKGVDFEEWGARMRAKLPETVSMIRDEEIVTGDPVWVFEGPRPAFMEVPHKDSAGVSNESALSENNRDFIYVTADFWTLEDLNQGDTDLKGFLISNCADAGSNAEDCITKQPAEWSMDDFRVFCEASRIQGTGPLNNQEANNSGRGNGFYVENVYSADFLATEYDIRMQAHVPESLAKEAYEIAKEENVKGIESVKIQETLGEQELEEILRSVIGEAK